jgi:DNA-binding NtrC family response regulator
MTSDSQSGTILVVDDDADIRHLAQRFLEIAGWTVVTAADGEEGLRSFAEHQSKIVLLLTDIRMPRINGLELANHVLGIHSELPVLLMSGEHASAYPGFECVEKPFRSSELLDRVSRVLHPNTRSATATSAA